MESEEEKMKINDFLFIGVLFIWVILFIVFYLLKVLNVIEYICFLI